MRSTRATQVTALVGALLSFKCKRLTNPDLFGIKLPICHLLAGRALPPGKFLCHSAADRLFGSQIPLSADRPNRTQSIEKNVYSAFGQRFFKAEKCFFAAD